MTAPVIQFKRGLLANLPGLRAGEPGFTTDSYDLYVGLTSETSTNKFFGSHRYWTKETESTGSGLNLVEGTSNGSDYITIQSPNSLAGIVTYILPGVQGAVQSVLTNDGSGNLTWASGSLNAVFSGITTIGGDFLDVNVNSDFAGITTFSNTEDNTLGDPNTGAVQIDGGLGVDKNVTIGAGLSVSGESYFIGTATFYGGTLNLGDSDGDNINVAGEFVSNLTPNADDTYDIGDNSTPKRWRHSAFSGVGTFATGVVADNVRLGIGGNGVVDTTSGSLYLDSASGTTIVNDRLDVLGDLDVAGNVFIGGTTVTLRGEDVFIENKDIVLGYTTSITPNDTTANHAGVAIASTEGTPLVPFAASGINTLPDTYKQLMWFRSGTLGFATDAFAFNYGVAIGTTTMADGVRLAVGSSVTISDDTITAPNLSLTSATVSNLTQGRVVLAGASGILEDSANLTFGAGGLIVGAGGINVTGVSTFSTDLVVGGDVRINGNDIQASDGNANITLTSNTLTAFAGDIRVNGNDIQASDGNANITLTSNTLTTFAGDIKVSGNDIQASDGNANITLTSNTLTTFAGDIKVTGNDIQASDGNTNITLTSNTLTTFSGDIKVTGNDIQASDGTTAITMSSANVTVAGDLTVGGSDIKAADGTTALTLANSTGAVTTSNDLTVSGNLFVSGNTTQVNTAALTVEDRTIDLGIVNGAAPASSTTWDLGVLFNYHSGGSAKKSAVIWEHGDTRFKFASVLSADTDGSDNSTPQLSVTTFAPIEIGALWVNDCAGSSQVISCTGTERFLENITIDAGTF
jgi:hypothetical protein